MEYKTKRAAVETRFIQLNQRLTTRTVRTVDVTVQRERIVKTREYFFGLVDLGTPDYLVASWSDPVWNDEIIAGMPTKLVLDYWGDPIAIESVILAGGPAEIWTYQIGPEKTEQITVSNKAVTDVRS